MSGCVLPAAAPTSVELSSTRDTEFNYQIVQLDGRVAAVLNSYRTTFQSSFIAGRYAATNALNAGDAVALTVYETGGQSLFPPPATVSGAAATATTTGVVSTGAANVPPQIVEADGTIFVPFVGRLKVVGLTPGQAGSLIEKSLEGKAIGPQVMVSLVNNLGNAVTVGGEVNTAREVPLTSRGERLLDVIAAAGGAKYPAYETYVKVMRRGEVGNVLLQTIVNDPQQNISVRPRDQIYLSQNPRKYAVLGATQKVAVYPFRNEKVTLAEAIADAGGPIDVVGNPSGIYLFRFEPWSIAKQVVPESAATAEQANYRSALPVVYQLNLRAVDGYFVAQSVQMRDKDVILITNAEATQLQKLLVLVQGVTGTIYDVSRR